MNSIYPLKFNPIFKEKIWGGEKVKTRLGLDYSPLPNCGEAWVLSGVENENSIISNGFLEGNELNELVEVYMDDLVGENTFERFGEQFPVLVKFIDSNAALSIQVHPDDLLAEKRHGALSGKTEMWYVLDADPDAWLLSGFIEKTSKEKYLEYVEKEKLPELLNREPVKAGDVFFIPAGTIHALGPGILLAEIQQTSDVTYRIYDWGRKDDKGNPRELHVEQAVEAINFEQWGSTRVNYRTIPNTAASLVKSKSFNTGIIDLQHPIENDYSMLDSFIIYTCLEGQAEIKTSTGSASIRKGEVLLIPAETDFVTLIPNPYSKIIETLIA